MHKLKVSLVVLGAAVLFSIDSYSSTCLAGRTFDKPKSIQEAKTADKDKFYREDEVDKQAQLSNADKLFKSFNSEFKCPDSGGKVAVTILLHKSGKVTDVKIDVSPNCSVTEKGRTILLRLKFTPATKSGAKVSEYMIIDIKRELVSSPGPS